MNGLQRTLRRVLCAGALLLRAGRALGEALCAATEEALPGRPLHSSGPNMAAAGRGELIVCCCAHRKEDTVVIALLGGVVRLVPGSLIEFSEGISKTVTEIRRVTVLLLGMGPLTMAAQTVPCFS